MFLFGLMQLLFARWSPGVNTEMGKGKMFTSFKCKLITKLKNYRIHAKTSNVYTTGEWITVVDKFCMKRV